MLRVVLSVLLILSFIPQTAKAFPKPTMSFTEAYQSRQPSDYNFEGIVALDNCSGSIIRFENSKDTDHALVLTNGHCYEGGFAQPNTYLYHQQSNRTFRVLSPNAEGIGLLMATEVIYSSMTKTDITIYKVQETYADILEKYNIHALTLSSKHPETSTPIEVISGYWQKGYTCSIEYFVYQLKEADWTSEDSIRYSRPGCETIGGTSGSPVLAAGTRTVIGINNTGNDSGEKCTEDNPCEVDKDGNIKYEKGVSYGQQTYWIYSCLNKNNEFDLTTAGCQLYH